MSLSPIRQRSHLKGIRRLFSYTITKQIRPCYALRFCQRLYSFSCLKSYLSTHSLAQKLFRAELLVANLWSKICGEKSNYRDQILLARSIHYFFLLLGMAVPAIDPALNPFAIPPCIDRAHTTLSTSTLSLNVNSPLLRELPIFSKQ